MFLYSIVVNILAQENPVAGVSQGGIGTSMSAFTSSYLRMTNHDSDNIRASQLLCRFSQSTSVSPLSLTLLEQSVVGEGVGAVVVVGAAVVVGAVVVVGAAVVVATAHTPFGIGPSRLRRRGGGGGG